MPRRLLPEKPGERAVLFISAPSRSEPVLPPGYPVRRDGSHEGKICSALAPCAVIRLTAKMKCRASGQRSGERSCAPLLVEFQELEDGVR